MESSIIKDALQDHISITLAQHNSSEYERKEIPEVMSRFVKMRPVQWILNQEGLERQLKTKWVCTKLGLGLNDSITLVAYNWKLAEGE